MEILKQYIRDHAFIPRDNIIKVDTFINHQIDPKLSYQMGEEFARRFADDRVDKILTIESSGIAPALMTAYHLNVPMIFVKKSKPSTMSECYTAKVFSFTKQKESDLILSKELISVGDRVLIIDDFLASGNALLAMKDLIDQANAVTVGAGIVIEKRFQNARTIIGTAIPKIESLVSIESIKSPNQIKFSE